MVFRKDTKVDAFQRQISALRQQLGESDDVRPGQRSGSPAGDFEAMVYPAPEASRPTPFPMPTDDFGPVESHQPTFQAQAFDHQTTIVAHDTVWNGDLQSSGTVHVHGRVDGSVMAKLDVFVAEEAEVSASISAENVSIAGLVRGTVRCTNRFEVLPQGRVEGEFFAPVLVVHEGATINGRFKMTETETVTPPTTVAASLRRRSARSGS